MQATMRWPSVQDLSQLACPHCYSTHHLHDIHFWQPQQATLLHWASCPFSGNLYICQVQPIYYILCTDNYDALNHRLIIVFWAACNTYPPSPNINLPANITIHTFVNPPIPNIIWPITQNVAVNIIAILGPFESISMPPNNGTNTFGNAYNEYNKLNWVYDIYSLFLWW